VITTEIYNGQGFGNQLFCYVTTRVIALDNGYEFGIGSPEKFKGRDCMQIDFGKKVTGGSGPEGGPPRVLPDGIDYYYNECRISHPMDGADIRTYDHDLVTIADKTKIDGIMQDEQYIAHRKEEIRQWLTLKTEYECHDFASDDICVLNFRGGEYVGVDSLFLSKKYWVDAMKEMRKINKNFKFVVITDDVKHAKKFFPNLEVYHFNIGKDYAVIKNAHYLILSNSSFAWFPAWLNENLKYCIAPKYWARHNTNDGFWSCSSNLTSEWHYLDKNGNLFDYETCREELESTITQNEEIFNQKKLSNNFLVVSNYYNDLSWIPRYTSDNYLVYDQSDAAIYPPALNKKNVIKSAHLGHNIRDYCTFVIDHYDALPQRTLFVTGNVFPRHISRERFDQIFNNDFFTPLEDPKKHKDNWPISFSASDGGFCEKNNSWYLFTGAHPTKYFHDYNHFLEFCFQDPIIPRYIRFAPAANYVVPRENILKYPKVFYENLRTFVSHCETAIPGESHILERAFHTIWSGNFKLSENMLKPIPKNFAARPPVEVSLFEKVAGRSQVIRRQTTTTIHKGVEKIQRMQRNYQKTKL